LFLENNANRGIISINTNGLGDNTISLGGIYMAAQNSENHPPLEPEDIRNYYNAGIQQYNNEFRTLGDRANAFLLIQSILVAALVLIFTNLKEAPIPFGLVAMGIILLGIFFCMLYIRAGRSGAHSAHAWRQYLLHLENENPSAPWN